MKRSCFHLRRITDLSHWRLTEYFCTYNWRWAKIDSHFKSGEVQFGRANAGMVTVSVVVVARPEIASLHPVNKWKRRQHFCAQFYGSICQRQGHKLHKESCKKMLRQRKPQAFFLRIPQQHKNTVSCFFENSENFIINGGIYFRILLRAEFSKPVFTPSYTIIITALIFLDERGLTTNLFPYIGFFREWRGVTDDIPHVYGQPNDVTTGVSVSPQLDHFANQGEF